VPPNRIARRRPHPCRRGRALDEGGFLCPVCAAPLLGEAGLREGLCAHVLLVYDGTGAVRYRDRGVEGPLAEARRHAGADGGGAMEALRHRLGPSVVFFDLLDSLPGANGRQSVTFIVDLSSAR